MARTGDGIEPGEVEPMISSTVPGVSAESCCHFDVADHGLQGVDRGQCPRTAAYSITLVV